MFQGRSRARRTLPLVSPLGAARSGRGRGLGSAQAHVMGHGRSNELRDTLRGVSEAAPAGAGAVRACLLVGRGHLPRPGRIQGTVNQHLRGEVPLYRVVIQILPKNCVLLLSCDAL